VLQDKQVNPVHPVYRASLDLLDIQDIQDLRVRQVPRVPLGLRAQKASWVHLEILATRVRKER